MTEIQDNQTGETFRTALVAVLPRLRRFCASICGSVDAGDDLLQGTVERALSRADQWQAGTRLDSWLFRIAQNMAIDQARSRKVRGEQVDADVLDGQVGDDGRTVIEHRSELAAAHAAMAALPEEQRLVMALVVIEGQSYRETADQLGIPMGSVMSRLARARASIDAQLRGTTERGAKEQGKSHDERRNPRRRTHRPIY